MPPTTKVVHEDTQASPEPFLFTGEVDLYTSVVYDFPDLTKYATLFPQLISQFQPADKREILATSHLNPLEIEMTVEEAIRIIRRNEQGRRGAELFHERFVRRHKNVDLTPADAVTRIASYVRMFSQRRLFRQRLYSDLLILDSKSGGASVVSAESVFGRVVKMNLEEGRCSSARRSKLEEMKVRVVHENSISLGPALREGIWKFKMANRTFPDSIEQVDQMLTTGVFVVANKPDENKRTQRVAKPAPRAEKKTGKKPLPPPGVKWSTMYELKQLLLSVEHPSDCVSAVDEESIRRIVKEKLMCEVNAELAGLKKVPIVAPSVQTRHREQLDLQLRNVQQDLIDLIKAGIVHAVDDPVATFVGDRELVFEKIALPLVLSPNLVPAAPAQCVLLFGPAGCGKSMLVRLLVAETSAVLVNVSSNRLSASNLGGVLDKILSIVDLYRPCVVLVDNIGDWISTNKKAGEKSKKSGPVSQLQGFREKIRGKRCVIVATTNACRTDLVAELKASFFDFVLPLLPLSREDRVKLIQTTLDGLQIHPLRTDRWLVPTLAGMTEGLLTVDIVRVLDFVLIPNRLARLHRLRAAEFLDALSRTKPSTGIADWDKFALSLEPPKPPKRAPSRPST